MVEVLLNLVGGFEDERVDEVGMLRPFEDGSGEMREEGVEGGLHVPDELHLPGQFLPEEGFNRLVAGQGAFREQFGVLGKDGAESVVAYLRTHAIFKLL